MPLWYEELLGGGEGRRSQLSCIIEMVFDCALIGFLVIIMIMIIYAARYVAYRSTMRLGDLIEKSKKTTKYDWE